ncbi:gfo/Idh/MocA family oxidoreductase [Agrobacterium vitis]|uniref:Gfo/Idh/MocA family protein n=1 Tax=Agrobacterium vitis TaxID=373 RepID=UPI0012E75139|nr:Gfo/Idh/MocA family oxidoreductase [Agrobacterium vitis]MVA49185.1 gfo/Idh/MocA family oxidoreductase [Agrobacterium vitis]
MSALRFAVIGINHDHIFGQIAFMLDAGAEFSTFFAEEDELAQAFAARYPQARRVADRRQILEDPSIALILSAAIPANRAEIAIAAMRHGKDVMLDKPGMTTFEQLEAVQKVQAETKRIVSILYSEHFETACTVEAGNLVKAGMIGEVIHTTGLGPHRLRKPHRPNWFFDRAHYGGVLIDIASHQCEQFLFFTGAKDAQILSASTANRANPDTPGLEDYGDIHLTTGKATGYIRVDWFTPDGLPTWGDGRLFIVGTEGTIELRKYLDIEGRPGADHLFLTDKTGTRYIDCSKTERPYGRQLLADIRDRTETAMGQEHCFKAMELALKAQAFADAAKQKGDGNV